MYIMLQRKIIYYDIIFQFTKVGTWGKSKYPYP